MKTSQSVGVILLLVALGKIATAQTITVPQSAPYSFGNILGLANAPELPPDNDTVLLEHFDGTTDGKVHGAAQFTQGVFKQGIHLNDTSFLSWNLGALPAGTVEFWFKLDDFKNHNDPKEGLVLLSASYGNLPQALTMQVTANYHMKPTISVGVNRNAGDWTGLDGNQTVTAGVWYHIAVTWGQSGKRIYLNGKLVNSDSTPSVLNSATGEWAIGAEVRNGKDGFNGTIDELRVSKVERQFTAGKSSVLAQSADTSAVADTNATASYSPKHFDVETPANPTTPEAAKQALADAKQELAAINGELDRASQEQADLESKIASGKRKIATLQSRQDELKQQGADLDDRIKKLQGQEVYVFQSAGASLDAQDFQGALQAYQDFVAKFPQSYRVASANAIISQIPQLIKNQAREAAKMQQQLNNQVNNMAVDAIVKAQSAPIEITTAGWENFPEKYKGGQAAYIEATFYQITSAAAPIPETMLGFMLKDKNDDLLKVPAYIFKKDENLVAIITSAGQGQKFRFEGEMVKWREADPTWFHVTSIKPMQ